MFRLVPEIWILCDHFWIITELLTIGFGFQDMVEQNSTLKGPEFQLSFFFFFLHIPGTQFISVMTASNLEKVYIIYHLICITLNSLI